MRAENNKNNGKDINRQIIKALKRAMKEIEKMGINGEILLVGPDSPEVRLLNNYFSLKRKVLKKALGLDQAKRKKLAKDLYQSKSNSKKKESLILLACDGTQYSKKIIKDYLQKEKDREMREWAKVTLQELDMLTQKTKGKKGSVEKRIGFPKDLLESPEKIFKKMPFFLCDRRCQECPKYSQCSFFKEFLLLRVNHIIKGKNYVSWKQFFKDVQLSFKRVQEKMEAYFIKKGIDLNEIFSLKNGDYPQASEFPLWEKGHQIVLETAIFLDFFSRRESLARKNLGVLSEIGWDINILETKLYRALLSKYLSGIKEKEAFNKLLQRDANFSAKLSFYALIGIENSLRVIAREYEGYGKLVDSLVLKIRAMLESIETEFPGLHQEKVIFHGKEY